MVREGDDLISRFHRFGEVLVDLIDPFIFVARQAGSAILPFIAFEIRFRVGDIPPEFRVGPQDVPLDRGEGLIDVDLHVERGLELGQCVGGGTVDGGLEFLVDQFVNFHDVFAEHFKCRVAPLRDRRDFVPQLLEF